MRTDFEIRWVHIEEKLADRFGKTPDLQAILFLIGMNEVGFSDEKRFSKEQKQDLMHVATCVLLSQEEYYLFEKNDEEGWPHYVLARELPDYNLQQQEEWLKHLIVQYFEKAKTLTENSSESEKFNILGQLQSLQRIKKSGELESSYKEQEQIEQHGKPKS